MYIPEAVKGCYLVKDIFPAEISEKCQNNYILNSLIF